MVFKVFLAYKNIKLIQFFSVFYDFNALMSKINKNLIFFLLYCIFKWKVILKITLHYNPSDKRQKVKSFSFNALKRISSLWKHGPAKVFIKSPQIVLKYHGREGCFALSVIGFQVWRCECERVVTFTSPMEWVDESCQVLCT